MRVSVRWLRELCPALPDDPSTIAARLTAAGLEVEATEAFGLGADACLVARVLSSRPHPSRSGLRLVTVDRGGAPQEVVCGAPNVPDAGGLVVLAPVGAYLPAKGVTLEKRTIAGVPSEGMLCSEEELGLGDDASGILLLPAGVAPPGTPLARALPASRDTVLEIGLTPNRPDALGHLGVAREAAALFGVPFAPLALSAAPHAAPLARDAGSGSGAARSSRPAPSRPPEGGLAAHLSIAIDDGERCPHYGAAIVVGATVGPSPLDVRWRLASLGVRPISNLVDVTNLVMLETGRPMHAFDLDRLHGRRVVVRCARAGEKLVTLDGIERTLAADDLVIADGEGPVALAGVMGGARSEIVDSTRRVLLECAYFDPRAVRRAARRHGLHTESSHRFERGVDWGATLATLEHSVALTGRLSGAEPVEPPSIFEARALARSTVALRASRCQALLGVDIAQGQARATLERLGFVRQGEPRADADLWQVPSFRPDVSREVDLVEEVARVHGFDAIPALLPAVRPTRDAGPRERLARRAREAGVALGLGEAVTYAFASPAELKAVGAQPPSVALDNPLHDEQSAMRTSLLPGLLRALGHARRHGERDVRMFTVGAVFTAAAGAAAPEERLSFAALLAGDRPAWLHKPAGVDVWDGKGLAEGLVTRLLRRAATVRLAGAGERPRHLHPRGGAWIEVESTRVGSFGPLHPEVLDAFDLSDAAAVVVEMDLEALAAIGLAPPRFAALPRFPASVRDLAVVVREEVPAGDVESAVRAAAGDLAERVALFDRFVGAGVPTGHASLAMHVVYRAPDRTLTDDEIDRRHAQVIAEVAKRFGAQLRA